MKQRLITLGVLAVLLMFAALIPIASVPASADTSNFDAIVTTGNVTVGDALIVGDSVAVPDVTVSDDLTVDGDVIVTAPARASLSATQTLVLATANVPISSTASAGVLPTCAAGKIFYVHNVGAQSIIITDSGTSKINGTYTMGNSDSITLLGVGSNCVELGRSNN